MHKYFRFFDNLSEIYDDLIKSDLTIKEIDDNNRILVLRFNVTINKANYEINIKLNKKELHKVKDIDIIISNYKKMKNELDELNDKINNKPPQYKTYGLPPKVVTTRLQPIFPPGSEASSFPQNQNKNRK